MFSSIDRGIVTVPLWDPATAAFPNNAHFMRAHMTNLIGSAYSNMSPQDVHRFVEGLFAHHSNQGNFMNHMRDFLIQFKEWSGEGGADLFAADREAQHAALRQAEADRISAVPGLQYEGPSTSFRTGDADDDE